MGLVRLMVGRMLEGGKWARTAEYGGAEDAGELSEAYGGCCLVHCRNCLIDLGSGGRRLLWCLSQGLFCA